MDDSISRQAAIETVKKHYRGIDNDLLEVIAYEMEELPSAQLAQDLPNGCTDTISRQAAINAADSIIECDTSGNNDVVKAMTAWQEYIKALPSAQPEIVRCKDCKEFRRWIDTDITFCDCTEYEVKADDFCSKAERRTDG